MPASARQFASASARIFSNTLPRWLCSMMPMPLPATFQMASCAFRRTGSGSAAGPALKLKMRSVIGAFLVVCCRPEGAGRRESASSLSRLPVDLAQLDADDVLIAAPDPLERARVGHAVEVDPRERGLG